MRAVRGKKPKARERDKQSITILALGKEAGERVFRPPKNRNYGPNRPALHLPRARFSKRVVRGMWTGGGHGGDTGGERGLGNGHASLHSTTNAPRLGGKPGIALVSSSRWDADDLPGVAAAIAVSGDACRSCCEISGRKSNNPFRNQAFPKTKPAVGNQHKEKTKCKQPVAKPKTEYRHF
jgi:hypothetical protein